MLADGKTQAQIADVLYVSTHTVHDTLRCIYKVLGVRRQAEAVATAFRMGLID
jgi:DNA-binding CsgD family transcriptional regulator